MGQAFFPLNVCLKKKKTTSWGFAACVFKWVFCKKQHSRSTGSESTPDVTWNYNHFPHLFHLFILMLSVHQLFSFTFHYFSNLGIHRHKVVTLTVKHPAIMTRDMNYRMHSLISGDWRSRWLLVTSKTIWSNPVNSECCKHCWVDVCTVWILVPN